jgi:hypothetical protein
MSSSVFDVLPRHKTRQQLGTFVQHLSAFEWVHDLAEAGELARRVDAET